VTRLLFFGRLGDLARTGPTHLSLDVPRTVAQIKTMIAAHDPVLGQALHAPTTRVIVNDAFVDDKATVTDHDEIAFLPPVSGG